MAIAPPAVSSMAALDADAWARLVGHARRALRLLEHEEHLADLRKASIPALLDGEGRVTLAVELAGGGSLWQTVATRLEADDAEAWAAVLHPAAPPRQEPAPEDAPLAPTPAPAAPVHRDRIRSLTAERDRARRQAKGAEARARAAEERADELAQELRDATARAEALAAQLAAAADEQAAALDKQQRRLEAEAVGLREELRAMRRADEERRADERRQVEVQEAAARDAERAEQAERRDRRTGAQGAVPGRPSRLPRGTQPGTSAAARALLTPRHRVLVDGYNVTLRNQGHLDLEHQRGWLVTLLEAVATRFRSEVVVLFDSRHGSPPVSQRSRVIAVRFTAAGVTADDEIVFDVEAAPDDQPILVVTDDRELRDRVRPFGVDLLGTAEFVRAVS